MKEGLRYVPALTEGRMKAHSLRYVPALPDNLATAGQSIRRGLRFTPTFPQRVKSGVAFPIEETLEEVETEMGVQYMPAWVKNNIHPDRKFDGFTLDWWTDTAMFRYDALLVSAFYGIKEWDFREKYRIPRDDFTFIADSGGFQLWSMGVKLEPIDILRWEENNADIALTLDSPPIKNSEMIGDRAKPEDFRKSIELSKRNYEIMHRNRQSDQLKLLKVIHGYTFRELHQFYDAVKDLEFDGHAFGANQNDLVSIARVLGFAQSIEQERVHMFLATGLNTSPLIIFAKRFFKNLTFDSASFSITGARYRKYYLPYNINKGISFGGSYTSSLKELPCSCPICRMCHPEDFNADGSLPGGLIALHNLWMVLNYYATLESLADSPDDYLEFLKGNVPDQTIRMVEYLLCVDENDLDYANKKYNMDSERDITGIFG